MPKRGLLLPDREKFLVEELLTYKLTHRKGTFEEGFLIVWPSLWKITNYQYNSLIKRTCPHCFKVFTRSDNTKAHYARCPSLNSTGLWAQPVLTTNQCHYCFRSFSRNDALQRHINFHCLIRRKNEQKIREDKTQNDLDEYLSSPEVVQSNHKIFSELGYT